MWGRGGLPQLVEGGVSSLFLFPVCMHTLEERDPESFWKGMSEQCCMLVFSILSIFFSVQNDMCVPYIVQNFR